MSPLFPSLTGNFEQLDGQRPGPSLYDLIMATRFIRMPRQRTTATGGVFQRVVYESESGSFRYTSDVMPNSWSTFEEKLELLVPEPVLLDRAYATPPTCQSIYSFKVSGHGKMRMRLDLRQGQYLQPLVPEFHLERSRDHEWNYCWTKEDPKTFFDRGDFDEIWKAMMLLKISIDRTDPDLRMRNRWLARHNVGETLFRRHLQNGDRKPYVP